jgi:hypothetical protein
VLTEGCAVRLVEDDIYSALREAQLRYFYDRRPQSIILLLQADLSTLVFRPKQFRTILCMNVLHQYTDAAAPIQKLQTLLDDAGQLYLTSLVSTGRYMATGG